MATDFTVIQAVRQRFGDETADIGEIEEEQKAPFVGASKDFPFSCPNVARGEVAVLQFQTWGVTAGKRDGLPRNILQINGVDISGGITPSATEEHEGKRLPFWTTHSLLVAANVLKGQNVLHIESVNTEKFGGEQSPDNFIIDNVVVFFKTREPVVA